MSDALRGRLEIRDGIAAQSLDDGGWARIRISPDRVEARFVELDTPVRFLVRCGEERGGNQSGWRSGVGDWKHGFIDRVGF